MPELTDEVKKAKEEGTEVAKVLEYCRQNMIIDIKDNELENVAAPQGSNEEPDHKIRMSGRSNPVLEPAAE